MAGVFRGLGKSIDHWWGASTVERFCFKFVASMRWPKKHFPLEIDHIVSECREGLAMILFQHSNSFWAYDSKHPTIAASTLRGYSAHAKTSTNLEPLPVPTMPGTRSGPKLRISRRWASQVTISCVEKLNLSVSVSESS